MGCVQPKEGQKDPAGSCACYRVPPEEKHQEEEESTSLEDLAEELKAKYQPSAKHQISLNSPGAPVRTVGVEPQSADGKVMRQQARHKRKRRASCVNYRDAAFMHYHTPPSMRELEELAFGDEGLPRSQRLTALRGRTSKKVAVLHDSLEEAKLYREIKEIVPETGAPRLLSYWHKRRLAVQAARSALSASQH